MKNQEIKFKHLEQSYSILIGKNHLNTLPNKIKKLCPKTKKIALIIDARVPQKFKLIFKKQLKNFKIIFLKFSANEKSKSIKSVDFFLNILSRENFNRTDLIISVGGGITGDTVGFTASIFKRGINFINIPTTLLAQVDSCIGG